MRNNNQQVMTKPATPRAMAASPSDAASPNSLSDAAATTTTSNNNDEEEEPSISSYYCHVHFKNEKAGSKDLLVPFAMWILLLYGLPPV
jgi:hypothetical protein